MKVLSEEQANKIVPAKARKRATKQEQLERRESVALEELRKLRFRVTLHELPRYDEADELLNQPARFVPGNCYAVLYGIDGKRKHVAGCSAVDALTQAQSWCRWQAGLKDDAPNKFVVTDDDVPELHVTHRPAGDTAETNQRRANTTRRILSFQSGVAEVVDAHGEPLGDVTSRASQYETPNRKGDDQL
jgi:hypothetical protein